MFEIKRGCSVTRIMIVDDDVVLAVNLEELLNSRGYEVVGVLESGVEAINGVEDLRPDLILMDIKMPGKLDGIDAAERIMRDYDIPVIFVTGYSDEALVSRAKRLNPLGYITKPFNEEQIPAVIEIGLYNREKERRYPVGANPDFTPQELRIAKFVGEGKSTKEIAEVLYVCDETVRWHRKNMRRKLGINEKNISLMAALSYSAKELSPR